MPQGESQRGGRVAGSRSQPWGASLTVQHQPPGQLPASLIPTQVIQPEEAELLFPSGTSSPELAAPDLGCVSKCCHNHAAPSSGPVTFSPYKADRLPHPHLHVLFLSEDTFHLS